GLPGTTAGPFSPPFSNAARLVRFSPPPVFVSPWHFWHFSTNSGRISFSKNSTVVASGGGAGGAARAAGHTRAVGRSERKRTRSIGVVYLGRLVGSRRSDEYGTDCGGVQEGESSLPIRRSSCDSKTVVCGRGSSWSLGPLVNRVPVHRYWVNRHSRQT